MTLVVDASMILSWYFRDEDDPHPGFMRRIAREPIVVPAHFQAEVANGVLIGERKGRAQPAQAANLLQLLETAEMDVDDEGSRDALHRILPIARAHKLTVYDAIYLELAERRGLPLATLDAALAAAAQSVGVEILGGEEERS